MRPPANLPPNRCMVACPRGLRKRHFFGCNEPAACLATGHWSLHMHPAGGCQCEVACTLTESVSCLARLSKRGYHHCLHHCSVQITAPWSQPAVRSLTRVPQPPIRLPHLAIARSSCGIASGADFLFRPGPGFSITAYRSAQVQSNSLPPAKFPHTAAQRLESMCWLR